MHTSVEYQWKMALMKWLLDMSYLLRFIKQIESFRAVTDFTFQNWPKIMTISQQHFVEYINNGVLKKTDILQMFKNYIIELFK